MRKSRFTEAQIIGMIKEQEAGMPTADVCRKHGLSSATFVSGVLPPRSLVCLNVRMACSELNERDFLHGDYTGDSHWNGGPQWDSAFAPMA